MITEAKRSLAYSMFDEGKTTKQVRSRTRLSPGSVAALKANWTRRQATKKVHPPAVTTDENGLVTVRLRSSRLRNAIANGQNVQVIIDVA